MSQFPGWRTMTGAQRRNAKHGAIWDHYRQEKTQGRLAYEADCAARPNYHDGTPRASWDDLREIAQWSWVRNV